MEKSHLQKVRERFAEDLEGKRTITLHVPDGYQFMAEDLIEELRANLAEHLHFPDAE